MCDWRVERRAGQGVEWDGGWGFGGLEERGHSSCGLPPQTLPSFLTPPSSHPNRSLTSLITPIYPALLTVQKHVVSVSSAVTSHGLHPLSLPTTVAALVFMAASPRRLAAARLPVAVSWVLAYLMDAGVASALRPVAPRVAATLAAAAWRGAAAVAAGAVLTVAWNSPRWEDVVGSALAEVKQALAATAPRRGTRAAVLGPATPPPAGARRRSARMEAQRLAG